MVADLFDRRHVVRRKNHRRPAVAQREDFVFQQVGVDRVEAAERFVENQQGRSVQYRDDELDLLRHPLTELLHLPVPPLGDPEFFKPRPQALRRFPLRKTFELREIERLFADAHFFIQSALFGQVADPVNVVGSGRPSKNTRPLSGAVIRLMMRINVVLPAPFGPSNP